MQWQGLSAIWPNRATHWTKSREVYWTLVGLQVCSEMFEFRFISKYNPKGPICWCFLWKKSSAWKMINQTQLLLFVLLMLCITSVVWNACNCTDLQLIWHSASKTLTPDVFSSTCLQTLKDFNLNSANTLTDIGILSCWNIFWCWSVDKKVTHGLSHFLFGSIRLWTENVIHQELSVINKWLVLNVWKLLIITRTVFKFSCTAEMTSKIV